MATPYSLQEVAEIGDLIERATAEHLTEPEWQLNIAICDIANSNHAIGEDIVRALQKKLRSESPRTVLQTLVLIETVVKNGPKSIHTQIGTRAFLNDIAALTDGSLGFDVQNQSLLLIKQWADAFSGSALTAFQDMYRQLKLQGVEFPESENDVPIFTPPPSSVAAPALSTTSSFRMDPRAGGTSAGSSSSKRTREQQIEKLHLDLQVVMEKITQFRDIWTSGTSGEELEDVLDFLRQCQPRMNTLIEGGIMGKIDEKTLEKCLTINDHLIKALEESRPSSSSQNADLMSFDSPPRASRKSDLSNGMDRLNLQESNRSNSEDGDTVSV
uniref:VHS domain-containing protein n=1 Tax=Globisporangium ultimum (strain ATCC 200006 / CBS 805.95 / DAOM BR144) TaxID=431595 RepID=K3WUT1_GLOUD